MGEDHPPKQTYKIDEKNLILHRDVPEVYSCGQWPDSQVCNKGLNKFLFDILETLPNGTVEENTVRYVVSAVEHRGENELVQDD